MESSETQRKVINLGKQLVEQLDSDRHRDTLSAWMAHYIAGLIVELEGAQEDEIKKISERCFGAILKLWAHHPRFPKSLNPMEQFDKFFETLKKLDPDSSSVFSQYIGMRKNDLDEGVDIGQDEIQHWLNVAMNVDNAARTLIEFSLFNAIEQAVNDDTKEWLKNSSDLPYSRDVQIIFQFVSASESEDQEKKEERKRIEKRIEKLKGFREVCGALEKQYLLDLEELTSDKK